MTVLALSVNTNDGTPPSLRKVASKQAISVGWVWSQTGITTRNLDHANQAQNNNVVRNCPPGPGTLGPWPQSNCNHRPGSVIHGRYERRCPARQAAFTCATARRVVRSVPANPIPTSRAWITSARTLPLPASTQSSIFGMNPSSILGRRPGPVTGRPESLAVTYRRTVFGSTPANNAAECALSVASNASRISMISLSDFFMCPSGGTARGGRRPRANTGGTPH